MIDHLSASGLRSYLTNPAFFVRRYILKDRTNDVRTTTLVGSAVHRAIEYITMGEVVPSAEDLLKEVLQEETQITENINLTMENIHAKIQEIIDDIQKDWSSWDLPEIVHVEQSYMMPMEIEGVETKIPVTGRVDMVVRKDGKYIPFDWKTVKSYSSDATIHYIIQGHIYMYMVGQAFNDPPSYAVFAEIKRSKNRDGSSRTRFLKVPFNPVHMLAVITLMNRVYDQITGTPLIQKDGSVLLIPNVYDMMSGTAAWEYFLNTIGDDIKVDMVEEVGELEPDMIDIDQFLF